MFFQVYLNIIFYEFLICCISILCPTHLIHLDLLTNSIYWRAQLMQILCYFVHRPHTSPLSLVMQWKIYSFKLCFRFKTARLLGKHATLHTGIKPHQCDVCGKQFRERGALREHNRIHTGAMPYTCEFCGKNFRFKGILTVSILHCIIHIDSNLNYIFIPKFHIYRLDGK
jgi:hypothetical protein